MINKECETIVAVGAIISEIPCVDKIDITKIKTGNKIKIENDSQHILKLSSFFKFFEALVRTV